MSSVLTEAASGAGLSSDVVVNDFSLQVATANGSGSQTANSVLMRSIFQMGVPVSGKNLFPSNIQGLPTWFTIRASKDGYIGRKRENDILVCMNPETAEEDVREVRAGAFVVYEKKLGLENPGKKRDDVTYYAVPFSELVVKITSAPEHAKLRKLIVNMIYVGVVADLIGIDPAEATKAIAKQLKGKQKAVELNVSAVKLGLDYAAANFPAKIPYRVQRMNATQGKMIVEGNAAAALGCVFAGATVCAWYPITPSSSLCESFIDFCDELESRPRDRQEERRDHPGRGRDRLDRDGPRRGMGRRARVHLDVRPRHLAHVRDDRPRLLHGDPGRPLRRPARRAVDRPADPDDAGRRPALLFQLAR